MQKVRYPIPAEPARSEIEVQRSRFITSIAPAATAEAALAFVAKIKQEFPDANHNCWAYLIGAPGSSDKLGLSDDGEPHGAAGKPMLTVIQHSNVGDIAVLVTRYFGGVKLGKGGMVKAYTQAVQNGIEQLPLGEKIDWRTFSIRIDYALLASVERALPAHETAILDKQFAEQISLQLKLPAEQFDALRKALTDLSSGSIEFPTVDLNDTQT